MRDDMLCMNPHTAYKFSEDPLPYSVTYGVNPATNFALKPPPLPPEARNLPHRGYFAYQIGRKRLACIPIAGYLEYDALNHVDRAIEHASSATDVDGILLNIASFGSNVHRAEQTAALVNDTTKTIHSYIEEAEGGAYWIASQSDYVTTARTGLCGGIGIVVFVHRKRNAHAEIVSTASPQKRSDPDTTSGYKAIQARVDEIEAVLLSSIAQGRKTTVDFLKTLQGKSFVGQRAVKKGLADQTGFFPDAIDALAQSEV